MARRAATILALAIAVAAAVAAPASAQPIAPYGGHNPFNCQLQDVGTGTEFPDPDADPFCVEYDKTQQNVTDFGIFEFFSREPARVAAATPKCFYFQRDHWTGSIIQGTEPELWHWDGSYFFDKGTGSGGVHLANFRIGGQPMDATPFAPPEFQPYLAPGGGGGALMEGQVPVDPACAAQVDTPAERAQVYYHTMPCGAIYDRRITPASLGQGQAALHQAQGPPHEVLEGTERFNVTGRGQLRLGFAANPSLVAAILTTSPCHSRGSVNPGDLGSVAIAALHASFDFRLGEHRVFVAPVKTRYSSLYLGIRGGVLQWLAIVDTRLIPTRKALVRMLGILSRSGPGRVDSTGMPY